MIKFTPLFSGSKGNCSLVRSGSVNILLDIGYSYKSIVARLAEEGLAPKDIDAIVITHEHSDHVSALPMWTKKCSTTVYAPQAITDLICQRAYCSTVVEVSGKFDVKGVTVTPYECSHDVVSCFGYKFTDGDGSFASITDTGCESQCTVDFLKDCKTIQIECNHDVDMLKKGPYSFPLKRRILSDYGHLSNAQTAGILQKLIGSEVKNVVLAHLSEQNNTKELAFAQVVAMYTANDVTEGKDVTVYVVDQYKNDITIV